MKKRDVAIALPFVLTLVGCALLHMETQPTVITSDDVFTRCEMTHDPYERSTWVWSPTFQYGPSIGDTVALRAFIKDGKVQFYQAYVKNTYSSFRELMFYDRACDANGNALGVVHIDIETPSWRRETIGVRLGREYLNTARSTGLNIKVYGRGGSFVFYLPGFYVDGFLRKLDECIASTD